MELELRGSDAQVWGAGARHGSGKAAGEQAC